MSLSLHSRHIETSGPLLLVHGGAWDIPDDAVDAHREGLQSVLEESVLRTEGPLHQNETEALAGVAMATRALEAHGAFNAGYGAMLNQDGQAELDAGIMKGTTLDYGAVMATRRLKHPVDVACRVLEDGEGRVRMLAGEGAERFAESMGIDLVSNETLVHPRERQRYERTRTQAGANHPSQSFRSGDADLRGGDTVGAVMRDASGALAAATSTGGTPFKPPGRVGDSPLPGAGFYADAHVAVSATGWGEAIAAVGLARSVRERVRRGDTVETAARTALSRMHECVTSPDGTGATDGCIAVTPEDAAVAFTTPRMARGQRTDAGTTRHSVQRDSPRSELQ
ncbi:isoaspartyl peptidase/L-asparaginase family protein [Salinibacter altiplanensis]|uniref:isoaspartyl peptidase/L-asparaginase family protein n=1 Tax=Salinibacter altiplanensis TaxID=1803181 RepID=UPI000C9ECAEA|nr:isoaspartyl peptidase/L-asparaginase [Salinibacter altiplanensis]